MIDEVFDSHQESSALQAAMTWYDEPDLWIYERIVGGRAYIHVCNLPPSAKLLQPITVIEIHARDESVLLPPPFRRITICGSIFISGVTRHVQGKRPHHATADSNPIV